MQRQWEGCCVQGRLAMSYKYFSWCYCTIHKRRPQYSSASLMCFIPWPLGTNLWFIPCNFSSVLPLPGLGSHGGSSCFSTQLWNENEVKSVCCLRPQCKCFLSYFKMVNCCANKFCSKTLQFFCRRKNHKTDYVTFWLNRPLFFIRNLVNCLRLTSSYISLLWKSDWWGVFCGQSGIDALVIDWALS